MASFKSKADWNSWNYLHIIEGFISWPWEQTCSFVARCYECCGNTMKVLQKWGVFVPTLLMSCISLPSLGVYGFWLLALILLWMVNSSTSRLPFSMNLDKAEKKQNSSNEYSPDEQRYWVKESHEKAFTV